MRQRLFVPAFAFLAALLFSLPTHAASQGLCYAECANGNDVVCQSESYCYSQDDPNGYVQCDGNAPIYCSQKDPLSVNVYISSCTQQTSAREEFTLRGSATGGSGSYTFTWSGAFANSPANSNPNYATAVDTVGHRVTVSVNDGSSSASDYVDLPDSCLLGP